MASSTCDTRTVKPDFQAAAWATIAAYCGWHVAPVRTDTMLVSPRHHSSYLSLPTLRVLDIEAVEIRQGHSEAWRTVPAESYEWDECGMLRAHAYLWPHRYRSVRVTLTHGYEWDEIPHLVAMADAIERRARMNMGGIASQSVNGASVSFQTAGGAPLSVPLLNIEKEALNAYRLGVGRIPG